MNDNTFKEQIERLIIYRNMETVDRDEYDMFSDVIEAAIQWHNLMAKAAKVGLNKNDFLKMVEGEGNE